MELLPNEVVQLPVSKFWSKLGQFLEGSTHKVDNYKKRAPPLIYDLDKEDDLSYVQYTLMMMMMFLTAAETFEFLKYTTQKLMKMMSMLSVTKILRILQNLLREEQILMQFVHAWVTNYN